MLYRCMNWERDLESCFGESNKYWVSIPTLMIMKQVSHPTLLYALEFQSDSGTEWGNAIVRDCFWLYPQWCTLKNTWESMKMSRWSLRGMH